MNISVHALSDSSDSDSSSQTSHFSVSGRNKRSTQDNFEMDTPFSSPEQYDNEGLLSMVSPLICSLNHNCYYVTTVFRCGDRNSDNFEPAKSIFTYTG